MVFDCGCGDSGDGRDMWDMRAAEGAWRGVMLVFEVFVRCFGGVGFYVKR